MDASGCIARNHRFINGFHSLKFGAKHLEKHTKLVKLLVEGFWGQEPPVKHNTSSSSSCRITNSSAVFLLRWHIVAFSEVEPQIGQHLRSFNRLSAQLVTAASPAARIRGEQTEQCTATPLEPQSKASSIWIVPQNTIVCGPRGG